MSARAESHTTSEDAKLPSASPEDRVTLSRWDDAVNMFQAAVEDCLASKRRNAKVVLVLNCDFGHIKSPGQLTVNTATGS